MNKWADLHIHTHFSDSTSSPAEVVKRALAQKVSCIAITDHDTIEGILPTINAASGKDLEVLAGIELSTQFNERDIHVLGYLFDYQDPTLAEKLTLIQDSRVGRMKEMIRKLQGLGVDNISLEEVCALAKSNAVGRPHLATIMLNKGIVSSIKEAFDRYLAEGKPIYVPKYKQTPLEAIELIRQYGGVSVLAHPMITNVDELIPGFVKHGLDGIEVYYANASPSIIKHYEGIAKKHKILLTGGSDDHGDAKKNTYIGCAKVPYEVVERLKERKK